MVDGGGREEGWEARGKWEVLMEVWMRRSKSIPGVGDKLLHETYVF